MKILQTLEKISFKKIVSFTFLAAIVLSIPVTVWVSQQETKLASKAYFEKPEVIKPIQKYGAPPSGEPRIDLVWPFLGKPGDAVLIEGENFGENPRDKKLIFSGQLVPETDINRWTPNLIEFLVPQGSNSGLISLETGGKTAGWPYFFTVYNLQTKIQVTENNDILRIINAPQGTKIEVFFTDGGQLISDQPQAIRLPSDKTIVSVLVKNSQDHLLPFFVEPEEFGF